MFILTQLLVAQMLFTCCEVFAENSCSYPVESDSYRTGSYAFFKTSAKPFQAGINIDPGQPAHMPSDIKSVRFAKRLAAAGLNA